MIAQHTTPRNERIVAFENPEEFENFDWGSNAYTDGHPLVIARRVPNGDWAIEVSDPKTDLSYPEFRCGGTTGLVSNLVLAIANGVVAMRTEPSTIVSI